MISRGSSRQQTQSRPQLQTESGQPFLGHSIYFHRAGVTQNNAKVNITSRATLAGLAGTLSLLHTSFISFSAQSYIFFPFLSSLTYSMHPHSISPPFHLKMITSGESNLQQVPPILFVKTQLDMGTHFIILSSERATLFLIHKTVVIFLRWILPVTPIHLPSHAVWQKNCTFPFSC